MKKERTNIEDFINTFIDKGISYEEIEKAVAAAKKKNEENKKKLAEQKKVKIKEALIPILNEYLTLIAGEEKANAEEILNTFEKLYPLGQSFSYKVYSKDEAQDILDKAFEGFPFEKLSTSILI